ncbi:MAG: NAD(P)H-quinone oxidoreductase [Caulobacterales bacterium]|nr:NAD(P)H-quinone oxidoreductase [Caulobacterales bacterium]
MRAIAVRDGQRGPESLEIMEIDRPEPGAGQVRIRVRAAGVNRPDLLQRAGLYPPPPGAPQTLGLEVAGEIDVIGTGVERWALGDRVCALLGGGGYADWAVVDAGSVLPVPEGLDFPQAAALPETVFTVWANVFEIGALKPGETIAVHGATSGIGTTAIQMARAAGARVIGTSRGAAKTELTRQMGVDIALDSTQPDFAKRLAEAGPDVVLDMVGGSFLKANIAALKPGGRLVIIAFQGGAVGELDVARVMRERLMVAGSTLRARPVEEKARLARAVEQTVWPWVAQGAVRPIIEAELPLEQAAEAHRRLETGAVTGKIVLVP